MPSLCAFEVKNSKISGKGVFALDDIPKGTIVWVFTENNQKTIPMKGCQTMPNQVYTRQQLESMTDENKVAAILSIGFYYGEEDKFVVLRDGTQFTNHSDTPNTQTYFHPSKKHQKLITLTIRDIKKGQQITQDYNTYLSQAKWINNLMKKHIPNRHSFEQSVKKV